MMRLLMRLIWYWRLVRTWPTLKSFQEAQAQRLRGELERLYESGVKQKQQGYKVGYENGLKMGRLAGFEEGYRQGWNDRELYDAPVAAQGMPQKIQ